MLLKRWFTKVSNEHQHLFRQAAKALNDADAVYITAGAGMGVDSGLPDVWLYVKSLTHQTWLFMMWCDWLF